MGITRRNKNTIIGILETLESATARHCPGILILIGSARNKGTDEGSDESLMTKHEVSLVRRYQSQRMLQLRSIS